MSDHLDFLVSHGDEMVADLRDLVELESPSGDIEALDAVSKVIVRRARQLTEGTVELLPVVGGASHLRLAVPGSGERPVLLVGHFDTVWPLGTLTTMPFRVETGRAHGPGVYDMKAGLVQALWAIRALHATGRTHPPLVLLMNSDEETGSHTSRHLIEAHAKEAVACLVLEPAFHGALKTARKGVGLFSLEVEGRAAHAGSEPWEGASAISEAARIVTHLHAQTNRESGTTVNVGTIEGGTRSNVVAAHARLTVDLRVATAAEGERMTKLILGAAAGDPRVTVKADGGMNRPPFERTEAVAALFLRARAAASELGIGDLQEASVGGGSDGNFCALVNPAVLDGLGAVGDGAHALSEHVEIAEMPRRAALLASLLESLGR